jgi:hypothetical protein
VGLGGEVKGYGAVRYGECQIDAGTESETETETDTDRQAGTGVALSGCAGRRGNGGLQALAG